MTRDQRLYCRDILDRIRRIESSTADGRGTFLRSEMQQDSVLLGFMIIGEAVKRLDPDLTKSQPHIRWRQLAGLRDMLIHRYHDTLLEDIWVYSQRDIPALKAAITAILATLDSAD